MTRVDAVHEVRKNINKILALLRLVRPELGNFFQNENVRLQGVVRELSELPVRKIFRLEKRQLEELASTRTLLRPWLRS